MTTSNIKPFFCMAYCSKNVSWRSRQFDITAKMSARHFCTGAELSEHFGTSVMVSKCFGSKVSWVWTSEVSWYCICHTCSRPTM